MSFLRVVSISRSSFDHIVVSEMNENEHNLIDVDPFNENECVFGSMRKIQRTHVETL